MTFKILSAKLTGNPDTSGWSQIYEYKPDDEKLNSKGQLFLLIATSSVTEGLNSVLAGRQMLSRITGEYYSGLDENPLSALKGSIRKVSAEFSEWQGVEIATLVICNNVLYSVVTGCSTLAILRNGKLAKLSSSAGGENIKSLSGFTKLDDIYVLGTEQFFENYNDGVLMAALNGREPAQALESLAPGLHSVIKSGKTGALFLKMKVSEEEVVSEKEYEGKVEVDKEMYSGQPQTKPEHANLVDRVISKVKPNPLYIKSEKPEKTAKKRISGVIGLLLLIILTSSIFIGVRKKNSSDIKAKYVEKLNIAKHQVDEAEEVFPLDSERARGLMSLARESVLAIQSENIQDPEIDQLGKRIEENSKKILTEYTADPQIFSDLTLLSENFSASNMVLAEDKILVLDVANKKLASVNIDTKRSETIAGPSKLEGVKNFSAAADVFIQKDDGIYQMEEGRKVIEDRWEADVAFFSYAGNIYVIDKSLSVILKYTPSESGFANSSNWLGEGITVNLTQTLKTSVDGMIWVLTKDKIYKFSHGIPQNFSYSGIFPLITEPISIFTDDQSQNLYILDQANNRVVVVDKEGNYIAQYVSEKIKSAADLVVSEEEKKLILLAEGKLYYIDLQN